MNDQTSTTTTNSDAQVLDLVRQAAQRGRERLAAAAERAAKQREEEAAADAERWSYIYHTLGLADWMHPYVKAPDAGRRVADCMVISLELPACAPVIFAISHTAHLWSTATCYVSIPVAVDFDDYSDKWFVRIERAATYDLGLLDLAIAEALQHGRAWTEMSLEAARRNDRGDRPAVSAPAPKPPVAVQMPDDPAAKILAHIAELNYTTDDALIALRGILYGFVTLALELRRNTETTRGELAAIRVAVEDLAAIRVAVEDLAAAALYDELADDQADTTAEQDTHHVN